MIFFIFSLITYFVTMKFVSALIMSLPVSFDNPQDYFEECFKFFIEYEYLYNFPNTNLLLNTSLDHIDIDGLEDVDVLEQSFDPVNNKCNDYLTRILEKIDRLKVHRNEFKEDKDLDLVVNAPLSEKKKHEIVYLAKEIGKICEESNCELVVDFGSGMGYLDQQIFSTAQIKVLGLECNTNNHVGAKKRQRMYYMNSIDSVKHIKHTVTQESNIKIDEYIKDKFSRKHNFCITGLHACADLTIDAMNLFLKMEDARALIIMPCCYHKLLEIDSGKFKNFPLSKCLRDIYNKYEGFNYLKVPFLRLAAQPPDIAGEKMENLVFSLLARATLQLYAHQRNCILKRKKRKAVKLKTKNNDFIAYVEDALNNGFSLISNTMFEPNEQNNLAIDITELSTIWRQNTPVTFNKTAIFVYLQNAIQPIFENFVLYDRLLYLKENGIEQCAIKRIVDERISPRCFALIAKKI